MAKKIYDIKPPKVAASIERSVAAPRKKRVVKKAVAAPVVEKVVVPAAYEPERRFPLREVVIGGVVIALLLGIYGYSSLGSATVSVAPNTEVLSFTEKITADKSYDNVNLLKKIIPARVAVQEKESTQQFLATGSGSNEGKAQGSIRVYNKISPSSPLTLKAGTHFLSDSGKYFVSLDRIVVPAQKSGTAGSVDVKIQAEESGAEYNIGASKFSVPGLSGTSYYYSIWAESKNAMTGGYTGSIKKVTADDISGAKDVLVKKLSDDAQAALRAGVSKDEVLLDGAIQSTVVSASADAKEGAIQNNFNQQAKVRVSALVFKKADVQKFALLDAQSKLPEGKEVLEKTVTVNYEAAVPSAAGSQTLNLTVSAKTYYYIDASSLADLLVQKTAGQIEDIVNSQYADKISAVNVRFWPFWVHRAPKDKGGIKIDLEFK